MHESFRKAELQALAEVAGVNIEFLTYDEEVCNMVSLL
jgi:tRNA (guanine10-N2)-methyltransferase